MKALNCQATGSRWTILAICLAGGGAILLASWLGGQLVSGLIGLAVLAGTGLFLALAGRSETIRGLRGDGRDERFALIDLRATAITGHVLILAVVAGYLVEIARGHDGNPFLWLCTLGGLTYVLAVAYFRWRG